MGSVSYIASRLSLSTSGRKIAPSVLLAIAAVALSAIVMICSIAVTSGFKHEIKSRVSGFNSHVTLYASEDDNLPLEMTPTLRSLIAGKPYVTGYSLETTLPAVLKTTEQFSGIYLRGFNSEADSLFLTRSLVSGKLPSLTGKGHIALSETTADALGLKVGDRVNAYFIIDNIRVRPLTVDAIYNTHFKTYDTGFAYASPETVAEIAGLHTDQGSAMRIMTVSADHAGEYAADLRQTLAQAYMEGKIFRNYSITDVTRTGAEYFGWLSLLDTNVAVIITLMTLVSAITLISAMLILIIERVRLIGIVRSLGLTKRRTRRLFVILALRVGVIGLAIGNAVAIGLLMAQDRWHFIHLDPNTYYIDFVPLSISPWAILALDAGIFAVCRVSLAIPSRVATRVSPADVMRNEE